MARKIVGITCNTLSGDGHSEPRQSLNLAYLRAVEQAGATPIVLPNTLDSESALRYLDIIDGLLLSGGADLSPGLYGQEAHSTVTDVEPDRDRTEFALTQAAITADMPILAICRGIQTLNVALGGTLYQDLPSDRPSDIKHSQTAFGIPRSQPTHTITIQQGTRLYEILGTDRMETNSMHHQAIRQAAAGFMISATASDGVVEAAEILSARYVIAVQFHPEETAPSDPLSQRLFSSFVAAL